MINIFYGDSRSSYGSDFFCFELVFAVAKPYESYGRAG